MIKNLPANVGDLRDTDSISRSESSPGGGQWQPIPVFLPGESQVAWQVTIHRVAQSWERPKLLSTV